MAILKWDESLDKTYHTGSSNCVLYKKAVGTYPTYAGSTAYKEKQIVKQGDNLYAAKKDFTSPSSGDFSSDDWDKLSGYEPGVAWNGVSAFNESPEGAEETALYADNKKYLSLMSAEEFGCSLDAYTYPIEFEECDGKRHFKKDGRIIARIGQQQRIGFGLCYRTEMGDGDKAAAQNGTHYRIHVVYNCICSPSERSYETIDDSPDAISFSWEIKTTKERLDNGEYTAYFEFDSNVLRAAGKLDTLLEKLYGKDPSGEEDEDPGHVAVLPSAMEMYTFATTGSFT